MNKNRWDVYGLVVAVGLLSSGGITSASAQSNAHEQMQMGQQLKVGKTGVMTFSEPHKVGDLLLPPGSYRLVHRTSGENHFLRFNQTDGRFVSGETECRIEPLAEKISNTAVSVRDDEGTLRIFRIEIAGENVAHLF